MYKGTVQSIAMKKKTKSQSQGSRPFPIRFDEKLIESLKALAEKDRRTFSDYVRIVLEKHVEKELGKK